ncbi:putative invertase inhibitor [Silene latifolia]|uniref:putative invertase inhibitor n=1 Tax=Silene latifolia TaxID=37657 RepID=UPI003D786208
MSSYTLLSLLHLLLFLTSINATNLINQTCHNSSKNDPNINYKFCVYALQSAPASQCANLTRLGLMAIKLIKNNVTDTRCLIKQLLSNKMLDKSTKEGLTDCLDLYSDSQPTLNEAAKDYRARRYVEANLKVSSVIDASTTCEQGFEDLEIGSPLAQQNNHAYQLSAIALSIMNMFHLAMK